MVVVIALLALAGIVLELRRRRPAGLLLLIPMAAVAAALSPRLSPYAGGKLLVVLSPAVVLMAAIGGFSLLAKRLRWLQVVAGLALTAMIVGVFVSDSLGYRVATLAPPDRLEAMTDAADHADRRRTMAGQRVGGVRQVLHARIKVNAAFEAESPRPAEMRKPRPIFGRYYDLDALTLEYVDSFPGIIKRRSPGASRPPASFELAYQRLLRGLETPGRTQVIEHLPLQRRHLPPTARLRRRQGTGRPGRPGDRLIAASRPEVALLDPLNAGLRPGVGPERRAAGHRDSGHTRRDEVQPRDPGAAASASG